MEKRVNVSLQDYVLNMLDEMAENRNIDRSALLSLMIFEEYNRTLFEERYPDLEI